MLVTYILSVKAEWKFTIYEARSFEVFVISYGLLFDSSTTELLGRPQ